MADKKCSGSEVWEVPEQLRKAKLSSPKEMLVEVVKLMRRRTLAMCEVLLQKRLPNMLHAICRRYTTLTV